MDCTTHGKITCAKYEVRGYPTLKVFTNGELSYAYDGPRDAGQLLTILVPFVSILGIALKYLCDINSVLTFPL